jgi:hypothetical protein
MVRPGVSQLAQHYGAGSYKKSSVIKSTLSVIIVEEQRSETSERFLACDDAVGFLRVTLPA